MTPDISHFADYSASDYKTLIIKNAEYQIIIQEYMTFIYHKKDACDTYIYLYMCISHVI